MQADERAWRFDRGAWSEVKENVFALISTEQARDLNHALSLAGYLQDALYQLGSEEKGFSAEVYGAAQNATPEYPYYVMVAIGNTTECIYIIDFPSLLLFLSQFGSAFDGISAFARIF